MSFHLARPNVIYDAKRKKKTIEPELRLCISQFQLRPAPPPPQATAGHLPALSFPGVGHLQILCCPGAGHLPTPGLLHRGFYWERKQIGSSVKDRKKLKRVVKACSWFYACISSLLIKPELHSEIGSYRRESTFFGYWIKFLLRLFEKHPFIFIKLCIKHITLQRSIAFNVNSFTSIPKL